MKIQTNKQKKLFQHKPAEMHRLRKRFC